MRRSYEMPKQNVTKRIAISQAARPTSLAVDAIVNIANQSLLTGEGQVTDNSHRREVRGAACKAEVI